MKMWIGLENLKEQCCYFGKEIIVGENTGINLISTLIQKRKIDNEKIFIKKLLTINYDKAVIISNCPTHIHISGEMDVCGLTYRSSKFKWRASGNYYLVRQYPNTYCADMGKLIYNEPCQKIILTLMRDGEIVDQCNI